MDSDTACLWASLDCIKNNNWNNKTTHLGNINVICDGCGKKIYYNRTLDNIIMYTCTQRGLSEKWMEVNCLLVK